MALPVLKKCCGCISLEHGCVALALIATAGCVLLIVGGSWDLPSHNARMPEDNLISMSVVMFATLSAISNVILLAGIYLHRVGYVQLSILFNLLFMVFGFLIAVVTFLYSPEFKSFVGHSAVNITLTTLVVFVAAAFCIYYALIMNSLYRRMKMGYNNSAIPV